MKFYYRRGTGSLAVHIALHEAGLPHQPLAVDRETHRSQDGTDFHRIHAAGLVPVLELEDGRRLTETIVILQYIAERAPAARLMPVAGDPQRWRLLEWLSFIATELHKNSLPLLNPVFTDAARHALLARLELRYEYVEASLENGPFLLGPDFSAADIYLFSVSRWAERLEFDIGRFPAVLAHRARIAERPAVRAAMQVEGLMGLE